MAGYIVNTPEQQKAMLRTIGAGNFEDLFADVPANVRLKRQLSLPAAMSEPEIMAKMRGLAGKNADTDRYACFLGAGAYDHDIPSVIAHLTSREEFQTAYTPYQPEISQGTLEAIFEYQTLICELTGMDVSNASMYDGATALAEAARMACIVKRRKKIVLSAIVHPAAKKVVASYSCVRDYQIVSCGGQDGVTDLSELEKAVDDETAAVLIQSPNFYGCAEDIRAAVDIAHRKGALAIISCDPVSLALLASPGELGADIAVGEGQALGNPLSFGGPYFGFFAVKKPYMRKMPGRIVGKTTDRNGKTGYVLTLQAREQHIRRERATSNICSNEAINALTATIYLSLLGKSGLHEVASQCMQKAHYLYRKLLETKAFLPVFKAPFFDEFVVRYKGDADALNEALMAQKIIGGLHLKKVEPDRDGQLLIAVTEKRSKQEIDRFVEKAVAFNG